MVQIVENYRDYTPPIDVVAAVRELLDGTDETHLRGLKVVVLTNSDALSGKRRRGRSWSRGRKARHTHVRGLYHAADRGEPAWIELFVDKIVERLPRWLLRVRLGRTFTLGSTFFHELGHHLHATRHPEHREPEDVADRWATTLSRQYVRRRHRLARLLLPPLVVVLRPLVAWQRRRYASRRQRGLP